MKPDRLGRDDSFQRDVKGVLHPADICWIILRDPKGIRLEWMEVKKVSP